MHNAHVLSSSFKFASYTTRCVSNAFMLHFTISSDIKISRCSFFARLNVHRSCMGSCKLVCTTHSHTHSISVCMFVLFVGDLPTPRAQAKGGIINGHLYLFGGCRSFCCRGMGPTVGHVFCCVLSFMCHGVVFDTAVAIQVDLKLLSVRPVVYDWSARSDGVRRVCS